MLVICKSRTTRKLKQVSSSEWQKLFCDALSSGPSNDMVRLGFGFGELGFRSWGLGFAVIHNFDPFRGFLQGTDCRGLGFREGPPRPGVRVCDFGVHEQFGHREVRKRGLNDWPRTRPSSPYVSTLPSCMGTVTAPVSSDVEAPGICCSGV